MNAIDRYMQMGKEFISRVFGKTKAYGGNKPRSTSAPDEISGARVRPARAECTGFEIWRGERRVFPGPRRA